MINAIKKTLETLSMSDNQRVTYVAMKIKTCNVHSIIINFTRCQ